MWGNSGDTMPDSCVSSSCAKIIVNGKPRDIPRLATIAELLDQLALPARGVAVEVNLQIVPRERHAEHKLADGDRLEIVSLVGGG